MYKQLAAYCRSRFSISPVGGGGEVPTGFLTWRGRLPRYFGGIVATFLVSSILAFSANAAIQQPIIDTYYIPTPANDLNTAYQNGTSDPVVDSTKFFEYAWNEGGTNDVGNEQLKFLVSIVARQDDTVIYYDQWENGYNTDITSLTEDLYNATSNPDGTQVWGDNDPTNGMPPGLLVDVIDAGTTIVLDNEINLPKVTSSIDWDGGDKMASTRTIVSTVLTWPLASPSEPNPDVGYKMGGSTEVWDMTLWGTDFEIPIGEDTSAVGGDGTDDDIFNRSALSVMAGPGGATVSIDANGDGDFLDANDINALALLEGENAYTVGIMEGASVTATSDVQVHLLTGHNWASRWESRFFAMLPMDKWGNDYYSPVSTEDGNVTNAFIYNPSDTGSIDVVVEWIIPGTSTRTSTTLTIPANSKVAWEVPDNDDDLTLSDPGTARTVTGQHYSSDDPFYVLSATDADVSQTGYDWGYALTTSDTLLPYAQAGWAVLTFGGDSSQDGNPLWVMLAAPCGGATCSTPSKTIYVDYDGDPTTGDNTDPNGQKYDYSFTADPLVGYQIFDLEDNDQTGTVVYTTDGTPIQVVYGEDPNRANATFDIDLGWTVPPLNVVVIGDLIYIDFDGNGVHDEGEPGLSDVEVTLTWSGGSITTYTLADGSYLFPKLDPGVEYTVTVNTATLPAGMTQTGDPDPTLDDSTTKTLASGEFYLDADFGYIGSGSIGDKIFNDISKDGNFDYGETGFTGVGVDVTYYGKDGVKGTDDDITFFVSSKTGGGYLASNLPYGTYDAVLDTDTQPPGTILTTAASFNGIVLNAGSPDYLSADFGMYWPHVKPLYLSTPGQCLDRIDPVATGDTSTALSEEIGRDEASDLNLNVRDLFENKAYDNQDSNSLPTRLWATDWFENDSNDPGVQDPTAGNIKVAPPILEFNAKKDASQYIERSFSASGANDLDLSFTIDSNDLDSTNRMTVEISDDGGSTWTVLDTLNGSEGTGLQTYNNLQSSVSLTSTMVLRFDVLNSDGDKKIKFDDVTLAYVIPAGSSASTTSFDQCIAMTSDFTLTGGEDVEVATYITASQGNIPTGSGVAIAAVLKDGTQTIATMSTATVTQLTTPPAFETSDDFQSNDYSGGTGTWDGSWTEVPSTGDIFILADGAGGNLVLQTEKKDEYLSRTADLTGAAYATFSFDFRRTEDINAGDYLLVRVSGDGGVTWPSAYTYEITGDQQSTYQHVEFDISSLLEDEGTGGDNSDIVVSLGGDSSGSGGTDKVVYFDNILFEYGPLEAEYLVEWTTTLGTATPADDVTVPSGEAVTLEITESLAPNSPFQIQYDSVEKPSRIDLPTETFIAIDSLDVYNAAYPATTLATDPEASPVTRYIRSVVSDPFGAGDIALQDLSIVDPNGNVTVVELNDSYVVASTAGTKTYEYAYSFPSTPEGVYTFYATAVEGTEGLAVIDSTTHEISNNKDIFGRVVNDADGDGDLGEAGTEAGLDNVTLQLFVDADEDGIPDTPGTPYATTTTGSGNNGAYEFLDIPTGSYVIIETNPAGYTSTNDITSPNDDKILVTLSTADATGQDFLDSLDNVAQVGDVTGRVIDDVDGDGDLAERFTEGGISGVTVELWTDTNGDGVPDTLYNTTTTDGSGNYTFADIPPGDYVIVETNPGGYESTNDTFGPNDDWIPITRTGSNDNLGNDFLDALTASVDLGSIGDTIYNDINGNGQPDAGEGIAGVTVWVDYDGDGLVDANEPSAVTAADGSYTIADLPVGDFSVKVDTSTLPGGLVPAVDPDESGTCSICDSQTLISLGPSEDNTSADFGYAGTGSIGDTIFNDLNKDGDYDSGEGIANAVVYIDANGNGVRDPDEVSAITDANGQYVLDNLPAGTYAIAVDQTTLPAGLTNTVDPDGGNDNTASVTIASGDANTTTDFGYQKTGSASGTVYDSGGNSALPGVLVELRSSGCTAGVDCPTTTTDANGNYSFDGLFDGSYTIVIDPDGDTLPSGASQTNDPDATLDGQTSITISGGNDIVDRDFGYSLPMYVTKSVNPADTTAVSPGGTLTYTLTPTFTGTGLLSNVEMADSTPLGTTYVSDSDAPEASIAEPSGGGTGAVTWDLGSNTAASDGSAPGAVLCPAFTTRNTSQANSADTYLEEDNPGDNFGSENRIFIDSRPGELNHGLIKFDVSAIPSDAIIDSVTLGLQLESAKDNTTTIYEMSTAWTESGATWNDSNGGAAGDWSTGTFSSSDYDSANSLGSISNNQDTNVFYTITDVAGTSGRGLADVVADWVDGTNTDNGLVMLAGGNQNGDAKYYSADDSAANAPYLVVSYRYPTTSSCTPTVRDEFSVLSFSNNDGSATWATSWVEDDYGHTGQDPDAGQIKVDDGKSLLIFKVAKDDPADGQNIYREVDLSGGVTVATLSLNVVANALDDVDDQIILEIDYDGTGTTYAYSTLDTYNINTTTGAKSYTLDHTKGMAQTRIRLRQNSAENDKEFHLTNVQVAWTLPPGPGGTSSMAATPSLVKNGDTVTIMMTVSSSGQLDDITPSALAPTDAVGGASCGSISGPTPATDDIGSGGGSVNFTWTCTADDGTTTPAGVALKATATATDQYGNSTDFSTSSSNSVLMPPPLTFQVTVDNPSIVESIDNQGTLSDDNVMTAGVPSNQVVNPVTLSLDFGDLPDSGVGTAAGNYQTTLADDGPRHIIGGTYLGATATDSESDGQQNATATGDDSDGTDDENGVVIGSLVQGQSSTITVTSSGTGVLNGWADWNGDGLFDESERIYSDAALIAGTNELTINVPPGADLGATAFRFRVTDETGQGGDSPTGLATTGEVEDYFADVQALASGSNSIAGAVINDTNADGIENGTESTIEGVTVSLFWDEDGNGVYDGTEPFVDSTTTAADGSYDFTGLSDLEYLVVETNPLGAGSTNDFDGNSPIANGLDTIAVDLTAAPGAVTGQDFLDTYEIEWAIGDLVWLDTDGDGIQDNGEPGLANVTLYLCESGVTPCTSGNAVAETITDASGNYLFTGEGGGDYYVTVDETTLAPNLTEAPATINPGAVISITESGEFFDVDFGYVSLDPAKVILGDRVWSDANNDGIQDPGEAGIEGVTVNLLSADGTTVIATTTTGPSGQYLFTDIDPGSYRVEVVDTSLVSAGYSVTSGPQSEGNNVSGTRTLIAGDIVADLDFGYVNDAATYTISDVVYFDISGEGLYQPDGRDGDPGTTDDNEYGLPGVTVNLLDSNGDVVATAITSDGSTDLNGDGIAEVGEFAFTGVPNGSYTIEVADTTNELGGLTGTSPPATGYELDVTVSSADVNSTDLPNFGYNVPGGIGDTIYSDSNGNGVQDEGEIGIAGVEVKLLGADGTTVIATATTDGAGNYLFTDQASGTYYVETLPPAGYTQTGDPDQPGIGCTTCDNAGTVVLTSGTATFLEADFGYQYTDTGGLPEISGNVWNDLDENAVINVGEPKLAGVTIELIAPDGSVAGTATTDANGGYTFNDVPPGDYIVVVTDTVNVLKGYLLTSGLDEIPVNVPIGSDDGDDITNINFGYARKQDTGSIGDSVWLDANSDGIQSVSESGISGVTLELYADRDGDGTPDTSVDVISDELDLNSDGVVDSADSGSFYGVSVLDGLLDLNGDGVIDSNDTGSLDAYDDNGASVTYTVTDGEIAASGTINGAWDATTTDANGTYLFTTLPAGDYQVDVLDSTVPAGLDLTTGATDPTAVINLSEGQAYLDADIGYKPSTAGTVALGDTVWSDTNGNGLQDSGEAGIAGVEVVVLDQTTGLEVARVTTGDDGSWLVTGLTPDGTNGTSYIVFTDPATLPEGVVPTPTNMGGGDTYITDLLYGDEVLMDLDFGYIGGAGGTIGDEVFLDADGDGAWDDGEGLSGVEVRLYGAGADGILGNEDDVILAAAITDANGTYLFTGLQPGDYYVDVHNSSLPGGLTKTAGYDPATTITLTDADLHYDDADFGYQPASNTGSIGNTVWSDADNDGTQDPGEAGIAGVTVELRDSNGTLIKTTTTDPDGSYLFTNLPATGTEDYTVTVIPPAGYNATPTNTGSTSYSVTDLGSVTTTAIIDTADWGFQDDGTPSSSGSIGDRIYNDLNGDGDDESGTDPGIDGVTVSLMTVAVIQGQVDINGDGVINADDDGSYGGYTVTDGVLESAANGNVINGMTVVGGKLDVDGSGTVDEDDNLAPQTVASTTTTGGGLYYFTGLPEGDYRVVVTDTANVLGTLGGYTETQSAPAPLTVVCLTTSCSNIDNADFGYTSAQTATGSIGDLVWFDADGDGTVNNGETGISGVTIDLLDSIGNVLASTITDASGNYSFAGLPAGAYDVVITDTNQVLSNLSPSNTQGTVTITCSDVSTCDTPTDIDFGYKPTVAEGINNLGGTIWRDIDDTGTAGVLDTGEPGVEGVTVELWLDTNGNGIIEPGTDNLIRTTVTDGNGDYNFLGLPAGDYIVNVTDTSSVLDGMTAVQGPGFPYGSQGGDGEGHCANGATSCSFATTLPVTPGGLTDTSVDFAYDAAHTISGLVYEDADGEGDDFETGDALVPGAAVTLYRLIDGVEYLFGITETLIDGTYEFTGLPDGDYRVKVDTAGTVVDGQEQTVDPDTDLDSQTDVLSLTGDVTDLNFAYWNGGTITTPISLAYFEAKEQGGKLSIEWWTATETRNIGFDLYADFDGEWLRLNQELIPSRVIDSVDPQQYTFETSGIGAGVFWITDLDYKGKERLHGPFELGKKFGRKPKVKPIDWKEIRDKHLSKKEDWKASRIAMKSGSGLAISAAKAKPAKPEPTVPTAINLLVTADGLYRVTYEDLTDAGLDLDRVKVTEIALLSQGSPVAVTVAGQTGGKKVNASKFGPGAYVEFVGHTRNSLYSDTNVYTLTVNKRAALDIDVDNTALPAGVEPAAYYMETVSVEHNLKYSSASPTGDPWYEADVVASGGPVERALPISIDHYVAGEAASRLQLEIWGGTDFPVAPDHAVEVSLNGSGTLASERFDGVVQKFLDADVPEGLLAEGENALTLSLPFDLGADVWWDVIGIEGYSLTYPRSFVARDGGLVFNAAGAVFAVDGLPDEDILVYRVDMDGVISRLANVVVEPGVLGHRATFPGTTTEATYYVSAVTALGQAGMEMSADPVNCASGDPARYLVVAHRDFMNDDLQRLIDVREREGYSTAVIPVDGLYAEYSAHLVDPEAIRACIADAVANRGTEAVLLVGAATYDDKDYLEQGAMSHIPAIYSATDDLVQFAPLDPLYVPLDQYGAPTLPIGRFPVRTSADLAYVVDKTLAYATKDYAKTAVLAADVYDAWQTYSFREDAVEIVNSMPADWDVTEVYMDDLGLNSSRDLLFGAMNAGSAITAYIGHSDEIGWNWDGLFYYWDVEDMTNEGRPTVVTQWGCWNTYFVSPTNDTLGHAFLLTGRQGAAAVLGASTLTVAEREAELGKRLFGVGGLVTPGVTLGEAMVRAKRDLAEEHPDWLDVILGWQLLGDPLLPVQALGQQ